MNNRTIAKIGTLLGVGFSLVGLLMGIESRGFHGMTLWFNFPAFVFCFGIFIITLFDN